MTEKNDRTAALKLAQIATLLNMIAVDVHVQTMLLHVLIQESGHNGHDVEDMIAYRNDIVERIQATLVAIQNDLDALDNLDDCDDRQHDDV